MAEQPEPWERRAGESPQAYAAFTLYRDTSACERSAVRVASEYGCHVRLIERWRSRNEWVERAGAFDAERDRRRREALLEEAAGMGQRQARDAADVQIALMGVVQELAARLEQAESRAELRELPLADLARLTMRAVAAFATAARVEREARGLVSVEPRSERAGASPRLTKERLRELLPPGGETQALREVLAETGLTVFSADEVDRATESFRATVLRLAKARDAQTKQRA